MLSKNMYLVLSCLPRNYGAMTCQELMKKCKLPEDDILYCLNEMLLLSSRYIRTDNRQWKDCTLYLTEDGLAQVEDYEQRRENMILVRASLFTAIFAMIASVASAVAAIIALCVQ